MNDEWIKVEDQLPEISTKEKLNKVQIYSTVKGVDVSTGYYWGTSIDDPLNGWSIMGVTHWKPLSKPPVLI